MFWTYGSLLVEYIKVHKKIETICWTFIKEKDFWYKKTTCPHAFLKGFKHIKGFSKHGEFSWKFWSCNFESIRIDFKFLFAFDILCSHGDFSNFQKIVFNDVSTHCLAFFFLLSPIWLWKLNKRNYCIVDFERYGNSFKFMITLGWFVWKIYKDQGTPLKYSICSKCWKL